MEAEAAGWIGPINVLGTGRAYLMDRRFIWIRRATPLIRPLLFWVPEVIEIELTRIERITLVREWWRAWLEIRSGGRQYRFRLGQGPYPFLKDNPRTTQQWFKEIQGRTILGDAPIC